MPGGAGHGKTGRPRCAWNCARTMGVTASSNPLNAAERARYSRCHARPTGRLRVNKDSDLPLFFYGLFMDEQLLREKGVRASVPRIAYLDGYRLCIGRRATLLRDPGARAHGVLMRVTREDAEALYGDDSVRDYVAEPVNVTLPDGGVEPALCYNLPDGKVAGTSPEYARALLELATRLGLPDEYLREIEGFLTEQRTGRERP